MKLITASNFTIRNVEVRYSAKDVQRNGDNILPLVDCLLILIYISLPRPCLTPCHSVWLVDKVTIITNGPLTVYGQHTNIKCTLLFRVISFATAPIAYSWSVGLVEEKQELSPLCAQNKQP